MPLSELLFRNKASPHLLREGSETTVDGSRNLVIDLGEAVDENESLTHLAAVWTGDPIGLPPSPRNSERTTAAV
jgi:hypothetical protein